MLQFGLAVGHGLGSTGGMRHTIALVFGLALPCAALAAPSHTVTVAAAANLKPVFEEIAARFQKQHPDAEVKATFGASGNFFSQIENGAPFDLFLSADSEFPAKVVEKKLNDGPAFTYVYGKLVVWVPKGSSVDLDGKGLAALTDPSVAKLAIANPEIAPYGRAAREALQKAGLYEKVKDKLVTGQSVAQTAQFVQSGNAQAAFLPLSMALAPPLADEGRAWKVPAASYARIEQAGVVLVAAKEPKLAQELAAFVTSAAVRDVFEKAGYELPAR